MKTYFIATILCIASTLSAISQKVYSTDYAYKADVKVYVVDAEYKADLVVYQTKHDYEAKANENKGIWYFTEHEYNAHKKIYFTDYEYQADIKVFFTDKKYRAGWKKPEKQGKLY